MIHVKRSLVNAKSWACSWKLMALFSQHSVREMKNNSILIVDDENNDLSYMAEVSTQKYGKGIVLKLQEPKTVYLAMYDRIAQLPKSVQVKSVNSWKKSTVEAAKQIVSQKKSTIYDVDFNSFAGFEIQANQRSIEQPSNLSRRRLTGSSPILNACYDIFQGDMACFLGCKGSQKTQTAYSMMNNFNITSEDSICIYVNPFLREVENICKKTQVIGFSVPKKVQATDVGIYFLTLKAINTCIEIKNRGKNVILVVDNFQDIMMREWGMLQTIRFNSKIADSSKSFQYNSLKVPPISMLNEIYSNCEDNKSKIKQPSGSMSAILISQNQSQDMIVQEISNFSNNLKHLQSLSSVIYFPLNYKVNSNRLLPAVLKEGDSPSEGSVLYQFIRQQINKYLSEVSATELKRSLYKTDIKDAPWDYYNLLDAQWWAKDLKAVRFSTEAETLDFIRWIKFNIESEYVGRWTISAKQSFFKFKEFCKARTVQTNEGQSSNEGLLFDEENLEDFIEEAKMEDIFTPFKKDYLY